MGQHAIGPVTPLTSRRLLARLARVQRDGRLPSVVAGLVRDGELAWSGGYGDVPGDPVDLQYRIGSITKTVTAVLVLQLVDEGLLGLDDPLESVLGDVGYGDRPVRELLAHDSGMQAEPHGSWWERSEGVSFEELVAANDGSTRAFDPRERFHYSNLGYGLLGEVVARLRGAPWWECAQARVLGPLGMVRTTYLPQQPCVDGFSVHPYAGTLTPEPATDTAAMAPAGQLWSTVGDLATYARFLLDGHPDVLSRAWLDRMATPRAGAAATGLDSAYGLGLQLLAGGSGTVVGHGGSMPGFLAACFVDRSRRTGAVLLANATTGLPTSTTGVALLEDLEDQEPSVVHAWKPNVQVPGRFAELLGVWHWGNTPHVFELDGDQLVVRLRGVATYRFAEQHGRIVGVEGYQAGEELHVVRREDGSVSHLDLATFVFTREPYDATAPVPGGAPD